MTTLKFPLDSRIAGDMVIIDAAIAAQFLGDKFYSQLCDVLYPLDSKDTDKVHLIASHVDKYTQQKIFYGVYRWESPIVQLRAYFVDDDGDTVEIKRVLCPSEMSILIDLKALSQMSKIPHGDYDDIVDKHAIWLFGADADRIAASDTKIMGHIYQNPLDKQREFSRGIKQIDIASKRGTITIVNGG